MNRNGYTVSELIAKLQTMPPESDVLLMLGGHDAAKAADDSFGLEPGIQTVGANSVFAYGDHSVYIVHSTEPD
jgi:hypothetical protein